MLGPEHLGTTVLVIAWVFAVLAILVVGTRFYVRWKIIERFAIDDGLIMLALALGLGNSIFLTISAHWGLGTHMTALSEEGISHSVKWVYLCEFFSILSPGIGRIAYASLLMGLLPPVRWRSRFLWSIIWIQFVVDCATIIVSFCQCQPISRFWDKSAPGSCWAPTVQRNMGYFQGSVSSAVDLILAAFPASMFWNLNMDTKKKRSLSCLMGLGIFAMIASIVKTVQLRAIAAKADLTYAMAQLAIWWTLEAYLVLIAASIPTLRPIVSTKAGRLSARRTGATTPTPTDSGTTTGGSGAKGRFLRKTESLRSFVSSSRGCMSQNQFERMDEETGDGDRGKNSGVSDGEVYLLDEMADNKKRYGH